MAVEQKTRLLIIPTAPKKKYDRQLPSDDFSHKPKAVFASEISIDISSATMTHSEESQGLARFHVPVGGAGIYSWRMAATMRSISTTSRMNSSVDGGKNIEAAVCPTRSSYDSHDIRFFTCVVDGLMKCHISQYGLD